MPLVHNAFLLTAVLTSILTAVLMVRLMAVRMVQTEHKMPSNLAISLVRKTAVKVFKKRRKFGHQQCRKIALNNSKFKRHYVL